MRLIYGLLNYRLMYLSVPYEIEHKYSFNKEKYVPIFIIENYMKVKVTI